MSDGSDSTPDDDPRINVDASFLTLSKIASPGTVGIATTVTFSLYYYMCRG